MGQTDDASPLTATSVSGAIRKIFQGGKAQWEKDELLDVLYWWRQVSSTLLGLTWALVPVTGAAGIFTFVVISSLATLFLYKTVLQVDEEEYGGHGDLLKEGLAPGAALFMLTWIISYSLLQPDA